MSSKEDTSSRGGLHLAYRRSVPSVRVTCCSRWRVLAAALERINRRSTARISDPTIRTTHVAGVAVSKGYVLRGPAPSLARASDRESAHLSHPTSFASLARRNESNRP